VTATSTLGSLPSLAPARLLLPASPGRAAGGPWIAGSAHPVLHLSWTGNRRIADLILAPDAGVGAFPQRVAITSPDGARTAAVGFGGLVTLSTPLVTDQLSISFPASEPASAAAAAQRGPLPIALRRLTIPGLAGLRPALLDPAAAVRLPCGQGPALTVDGRSYPTAVTGPAAALAGFAPVQVRLCAPGSALRLPPGRHQLTAARPGPFALASLTLTSTSGTSAAPPAAPARALRVTGWQADRRTLRVAAGPESYLELHQNANPGWVATLHGRRLRPVTLDGWQQGYVLPAGPGGTVTLAYAPDGVYHLLLIVSAAGVLLLLAAAAPRRRRRVLAPAGPAVTSPAPDPGAPAADPGAGAPPARRPAIASAAAVAALAALILIAGGPVAVVVPLLAAVAWWRPRWLPPVAAAGLLAAGVITAAAARPAALGSGAFSAAAQACALTALAAALMPALHRRAPRAARNVPDSDSNGANDRE
jgi:arabinofuranan 3-O-arabinosyltransferase